MNGLTRARFQRLASLTLFAGMSEPDLVLVAETARWENIPAGQVVMREGEEGNDLLVVTSGRFEVSVGQGRARVTLAAVGAGEVLGEAVLFRRAVARSADVTALEESEALRLTNADLEALARVGNGLPHAVETLVLATLAERIRASRELVSAMLKAEETAPAQGGLWARLKGLVGA